MIKAIMYQRLSNLIEKEHEEIWKLLIQLYCHFYMPCFSFFPSLSSNAKPISTQKKLFAFFVIFSFKMKSVCYCYVCTMCTYCTDIVIVFPHSCFCSDHFISSFRSLCIALYYIVSYSSKTAHIKAALTHRLHQTQNKKLTDVYICKLVL